MSNRLQILKSFRQLKIPTPHFRAVAYQADGLYEDIDWELPFNFPVAVRDSFSGRLRANENPQSCFNVRLKELTPAIQAVFSTYPEVDEEQVIVQEMIYPEVSGQLRAYKDGVWLLSAAFRSNGQANSPQEQINSIPLPQFRTKFNWKPFPSHSPFQKMIPHFVRLAKYSQKLLQHWQNKSWQGFDIQFGIADRKLYLLSAKALPKDMPIELLYYPLLSEKAAFFHSEYYNNIEQRYIAALNTFLSTIATTPAKGKLPIFIDAEKRLLKVNTLLDHLSDFDSDFAESFLGLQDPYHCYLSGWKKWRIKTKWAWKTVKHIVGLNGLVERKKYFIARQTEIKYQQRAIEWEAQPEQTWQDFEKDLENLYRDWFEMDIQLHFYQVLLYRFFKKVKLLSPSFTLPVNQQHYFKSYWDLNQNKLSQDDFLDKNAFRGFNEIDIGLKRFDEYESHDWIAQLFHKSSSKAIQFEQKEGRLKRWLLRPFYRHIELREKIKRQFVFQLYRFRWELKEVDANRNWSSLPFDTSGILQPSWWQKGDQHFPERYTLQPDYHLYKGEHIPESTPERFFPISNREMDGHVKGVGLYPGKVKGRIWKPEVMHYGEIERPDFEVIILSLPSLNMAWSPFWLHVDAILSYGGSVLSNESIVLKQLGIPTIGCVPPALELQTGDWVVMDGETGSFNVIAEGNESL